MPESQKPPASGATVIADGSSPTSGSVPPPPSTISPAAPADPLVGTILAQRYRILRRLGEGGMGTVYLGEHTTINKKLAIKVLSEEFSHKQDLVDRFLQEARAASMIEQENVVEITDFGNTPNGSVFFIMEYLQGEDLSHTVKREGPLPWPRVRAIILQVCRALDAAHERGIIHRDMKPENCFRIRRGSNQDFIKVLDFGIAKVTSEETEGGKGLTRTGMIFGTPEYMSPEQAKGERPDHRVDIYALGVIMYELLTGRVPFTADTFMGILTKHMFEAPAAPSSVSPGLAIPPEAEAIILKALQKDREYRFASMQEMATAIEAVGTGTVSIDLVREDIARPAEGRTEFTTQFPRASTYPPPLDDVSGERSRLPLMLGGAAIALLVLGGGAWAMFGTGKDEPQSPTTQAVAAIPAAQPAPPMPEPEPEIVEDIEPDTKVLPAAIPKVTFKIATPGVDAWILDARDEGQYGKTNAADGIAVEKSQTPLELLLRADGYEDLRFSIIPDDDKTFRKALKKIAKPVVKRPSRPTRPKKSEPEKPSTKQPEKPPPRKPTRVNSDLKNPFGN